MQMRGQQEAAGEEKGFAWTSDGLMLGNQEHWYLKEAIDSAFFLPARGPTNFA